MKARTLRLLLRAIVVTIMVLRLLVVVLEYVVYCGWCDVDWFVLLLVTWLDTWICSDGCVMNSAVGVFFFQGCVILACLVL